MTINRKDTLRELSHKRRIFIRNIKSYGKVYYCDWVYSFGIGKNKKAKRLYFKVL